MTVASGLMHSKDIQEFYLAPRNRRAGRTALEKEENWR